MSTSKMQWSARLIGADCLQVACSAAAVEVSATTGSSQENLAAEVCFMSVSIACATGALT